MGLSRRYHPMTSHGRRRDPSVTGRCTVRQCINDLPTDHRRTVAADPTVPPAGTVPGTARSPFTVEVVRPEHWLHRLLARPRALPAVAGPCAGVRSGDGHGSTAGAVNPKRYEKHYQKRLSESSLRQQTLRARDAELASPGRHCLSDGQLEYLRRICFSKVVTFVHLRPGAMEGLNGNGVGGNGVGREAKEISVSPPKKLLPTLRKPNGKAQSSEEEGEGAGEGLSAVNGDEDAYEGSNMDLVSNGNGSRSSFKKRRAHETLKKSMYRFGRTKPGFDPKTDYDALLGVANYSHVNVTKVKIVCRQLIAQSTLFRQFLKSRNAYATNGMRSAIMNVLVEPPYRDTSYQFKTWYDVASVDDWWNWHQTVLLDSFYVSTYYNGKQANKIDQQVVMQHIRLNGGFRLTQRRVAPDSCAAQRTNRTRDSSRFKAHATARRTWLGDVAERGAKNESIVYSYESKSFYENGYYEYFGGAGQLEESRAKMQELKDNLWVNDGTRWLRTDFVGHNPNLGLLMQVELYAEISLGGQITTSYFIQGMEINKYACRTDFMRLGLEIVFLACYLGYLVQEVRDYRVLRAMNQSFSSILLNFWNVYDWIYFILVAILIAIRLYMIFTPLAPNLTVTADGIFSGTDRLELSMSSTIVESYFTLCGIVAGLSTVKLLNYFRINIHLSVLTQTLVLMRKVRDSDNGRSRGTGAKRENGVTRAAGNLSIPRHHR
eukprot:768377-Hanusia_phi.AAC.10